MSTEIEPGSTGATLLYPQDRLPYVIVGYTEKTIDVVPLLMVSYDTGHQPSGKHNGYPVWDHTYTDDEIQRFALEVAKQGVWPKRAYLRKDGRHYLGGTPMHVGAARFRRDYAD